MLRKAHRMFGAAHNRALDRYIFERRVKFRELSRAEIENVSGQSPDSGA
jgi:hypothetical protein